MNGEWFDIGILPQGEPGTPGAPGAPGAPGTPGENGEDGRPGDRFFVYTESFPERYDLYRIEQRWNGTIYENFGIPVLMVSVPIATVPANNLILYIEPRLRQNEGVDYIAFPEGRYMYYNVVTGETTVAGDWFTIGEVLIAPQGQQGEPGEQGIPGDPGAPGATGESIITVINTPTSLPGNAEVKAWSFIALQMSEYYSKNMAQAYVSTDWFDTYQSLYRFANMLVPLDAVWEVIQGITPAVWNALQNPIYQEAAAKLIYCKIVNHPQLSDIEIVQISMELGNPLTIAPTVENVPAIIAATAFISGRTYPQPIRNYIANLRMAAYTQSTLPDYSLSTTCTPPFEDWNKVFDFTIDQQGWIDRRFNQGTEAVYYAGAGWGRFGTNAALWIRYDFPAAVNLKTVEVICDPYEATNLHRFGSGTNSSEAYSNLAQYNPPAGMPNALWSWSGQRTTGALAINVTSTAGTGRIVRCSIAGIGYNPFE